MDSFPGKTRRWTFLSAPSKNSFVCYIPVGFVNGSLFGYQSQVTWGPDSQAATKKLGCRNVHHFLLGIDWWLGVGYKKMAGKVSLSLGDEWFHLFPLHWAHFLPSVINSKLFLVSLLTGKKNLRKKKRTKLNKRKIYIMLFENILQITQFIVHYYLVSLGKK